MIGIRRHLYRRIDTLSLLIPFFSGNSSQLSRNINISLFSSLKNEILYNNNKINYSTGLSVSETKEIIKESNEYLPETINFTKNSSIEGHETQILNIILKPNQKIKAEAGSLIYMEDGIDMETSARGGLSRFLTGGNIFVTEFENTNESDHSTITLGAYYPSKIMKIKLSDFDGKFIAQKGAFIASSEDVEINTEFVRKITTGFFGGEGFILQSLTSDDENGTVFVKAGGALIVKDLKEGETLKVTSGSLVGFAPTVDYDVETVKGVKNMMFGGEGLFLSRLQGPGKVYLQSMPFDRLVGSIASQIPGGGGPGFIPMGMGGGGGGAEGAEGEVGGEEALPLDGGEDDIHDMGNDSSLYGDAVSDNTSGFEEATFEEATFDDGFIDDDMMEEGGEAASEAASGVWDVISGLWSDD